MENFGGNRNSLCGAALPLKEIETFLGVCAAGSKGDSRFKIQDSRFKIRRAWANEGI